MVDGAPLEVGSTSKFPDKQAIEFLKYGPSIGCDTILNLSNSSLILYKLTCRSHVSEQFNTVRLMLQQGNHVLKEI
jgi:hypothetical protein